MEEYDNIDPDFLKGFNEGYVISKHMPELAEHLAAANATSSRGEGFNAGKEQYSNEQFENRMPSWLNYDPSKDTSSPEHNKDKGQNMEPER
jgi:hypothetical protein